jgi:hypothetical protein
VPVKSVRKVLDSNLVPADLILRTILGSSQDADDYCTLLSYYAASSGNFVQTFRNSWPLKMGYKSCSETSVLNYH